MSSRARFITVSSRGNEKSSSAAGSRRPASLTLASLRRMKPWQVILLLLAIWFVYSRATSSSRDQRRAAHLKARSEDQEASAASRADTFFEESLAESPPGEGDDFWPAVFGAHVGAVRKAWAPIVLDARKLPIGDGSPWLRARVADHAALLEVSEYEFGSEMADGCLAVLQTTVRPYRDEMRRLSGAQNFHSYSQSYINNPAVLAFQIAEHFAEAYG